MCNNFDEWITTESTEFTEVVKKIFSVFSVYSVVEKFYFRKVATKRSGNSNSPMAS